MSILKDQSIRCPCCDGVLHPRAPHCPKCGFEPPVVAIRDLLGSLGTICSILAGFVLASIVTLIAEGSGLAGNVAASLSVLILIVATLFIITCLMIAEFLRRREFAENHFEMEYEQARRFEERCDRVFTLFGAGLAFTVLGIVALGFALSALHGWIAVAMIPVAFLLMRWVRR